MNPLTREYICFGVLSHVQVGGIVDQLVRFGKVTRPILGIKFAPDQSVEQLGVSGVLVLDAPPTGPAGKAVSLSIYSAPLCSFFNIVVNGE